MPKQAAATSHGTDSRDGFISALSSASTGYDLFKIIKAITVSFGYEHFVAMRLPTLDDDQIASLAIVTNWNPEFIRAFDSMKLLNHSPAIARLRESVLPVTWSLEKDFGKDSDASQEAVALYRAFGFYGGVYFSVSDKSGSRGAFGFDGNRPEPDEGEKIRLAYLASHAFEYLINNDRDAGTAKAVLTVRERDCIQWTAAGKTSSEVAAILSISENTVNHYLSTAALKLNTVNKAHTVARAIRLGLIDA
ncbi:MAG: autoinducer binding domain-containing protein [Nitratireductor sp.]|nr:autoinducer binding domain-containing protein [Nitratireductor sp.]